MRSGAPALARGLAILKLLAKTDRAIGFEEIMRELELPRATCARLLNLLVTQGYVLKPASGGHRLGPRAALLVPRVSSAERLRIEGVTLLKALRDHTDGTALLFAWDGRTTTLLAKEPHPDSPSMRPVGRQTESLAHPPWGMLAYHHLDAEGQVTWGLRGWGLRGSRGFEAGLRGRGFEGHICD